jgi:tape measure domain-containing protein
MPFSTDQASIKITLVDVGQVVAGAKAERDAILGIGEAASLTGKKLDETKQRSWLFNQALFTARRYLYGFTLAASATVVSLVAMGWQFDSFRQQSTLAFTSLLGNAGLARQEITTLFNIAAKTPFTFQNVTATARQFLAFGFTLQDTNKYLNVLGDTVSAFGLSGEQISHLAVVFGQIHQSGRLLGQDMRQLEQAGIPVFPALRKELGLTQKQIEQFMKGQLVIPSQYGIPAIMKYLQQRFGGMAAIQSKTFQGEASTFKDYISQLMGTLELGLFNRSTKTLGKVNDALVTLTKTAQNKGITAFINQLDSMLGLGGKLSFGFDLLVSTLKYMWFAARNIYTIFKDVSSVLFYLFAPLFLVIKGVEWLGTRSDYLYYVLYPLVGLMYVWGIYMVYAAIWTKIAAIATWLYEAALWALQVATVAAFIAQSFLNVAREDGIIYALYSLGVTWGLVGAYEAVTGAATSAAGAVWTFTVALLSNPLTWVILAVIALYVAFVILMVKVKAFREFMLHFGWAILMFIPGLQVVAVILMIIGYWKQFKDVFVYVVNFVKSHWLDLVLFLTTFGAGNILYHFWDPMVAGLTNAWNWIKQMFWNAIHWIETTFQGLWDKVKKMAQDALDPRNWLPFGTGSVIGGKGKVHFGWKDALKFAIPFASPFLNADGGVLSQGGYGVVGEKGPELIWMPKGTNISPMSRVSDPKYQPIQPYGGNGAIHIHVPVNIHGNAIAEANAAVMLDHMARA